MASPQTDCPDSCEGVEQGLQIWQFLTLYGVMEYREDTEGAMGKLPGQETTSHTAVTCVRNT